MSSDRFNRVNEFRYSGPRSNVWLGCLKSAKLIVVIGVKISTGEMDCVRFCKFEISDWCIKKVENSFGRESIFKNKQE